MTVNAATLRKLSALSLSAEQMAGVLDILADNEEADEARKAAQRERTRRAREKQRNVTVARQTHDGISDDTRGGVTRVEDKPLNSETSKEGNRESARAVRLAEDWTLPVEWKLEAVGMGLPPERCDIEAATMRDWSCSHPNGAKRNWRAAWRNWVRRSLARAGPAPPEKNSLANGFKNIAAGLRQQSEIRSGESGPGIRKALPDLSVVSGGRG